jgi:hypothetical protein
MRPGGRRRKSLRDLGDFGVRTRGVPVCVCVVGIEEESEREEGGDGCEVNVMRR